MILAEATRISPTSYGGGGMLSPSGRTLQPGVSAKLPDDQVVVVDRVNMWTEGATVCLSMWPAELKKQYARLYSDPARVEALIALTNELGWDLYANFHIAFHHAQPLQRWYPSREVSGPDYVRQWVRDFAAGCAGARTREQLEQPVFREWLTERRYATGSELSSLDRWLSTKARGLQLQIRPSAQLLRTWDRNEAVELDRRREFGIQVREAINHALSALDEPKLEELQLSARIEKPPVAKPVAQPAVPEPMCPSCHLQHAGECF